MPRGIKLTDKKKLDLLNEICIQLGIENSNDLANPKNKTINAAALEAILNKVSLLTGIPPKGISKDEENWNPTQRNK